MLPFLLKIVCIIRSSLQKPIINITNLILIFINNNKALFYITSTAQNHHLEVSSSQTVRTGIFSKIRVEVFCIVFTVFNFQNFLIYRFNLYIYDSKLKVIYFCGFFGSIWFLGFCGVCRRSGILRIFSRNFSEFCRNIYI